MHASSAVTNKAGTVGHLDVLFDWFAWENRDVRLDDFPLMASIWPTVFICLTYIFLVKVVIPTYMCNREPLDCYVFMTIYNIVQVVCNFAVGYSIVINYWDGGHGWCTLKFAARKNVHV
jgi:amino acid transporter